MERTEHLLSFYEANRALPSTHSLNACEAGLVLFLNMTIRPRYKDGSLCPVVARMLEHIPGALVPVPPQPPAPVRENTRRANFERWLTRAEIYTKRHGYRPAFDDDNALYQWLNRARRKLAAGELDEALASRVSAVLDFPDFRTFRYRQIHGEPLPEESRRRLLGGL